MSAIQSALHPAGDHAAITGQLFALFLGVTGFFFLLVLLFLGWAIWRKDRGTPGERRLRVSVAAWAGLITLGLFGLTIASYAADRGLFFAGSGQVPIQVKVTAQQWWWEVEYDDRDQSRTITTANEIHLPLGRPAQVTLVADDVIHSLWIPNLAGKQDLIPGRRTDLQLLPRRTGHFRAQCAEFCGLQHAHMALDVIVETPEQFAAWAEKSRQPAPPPVTDEQKRGYAIVMSRQCAACHAITGTDAYGSVGPALTRVASRATLAAGEVPNVRTWLDRWIADPQGLKPGNRMPKIPLSPGDRRSVVAYLETLK
ncbi:c-type cytochrome [Sphingomonas cannabina]|uniref:cytochrome c oxidase subunit II n=1 Tax=Sphingomonas cannabina TaxID=2899123 RepID=UPI001F17F1C0|nr:c-type cytochrome [Sphingomonas cannabina]UIJ44842.1 c-type cytochrome [Sphingomonas cannabina]